MTDTRNTEPRGRLWHMLNRSGIHHTLQYRIVHYGFWSSIVLLVMMFLDMIVPGLFIFGRLYMWLGLAYVLIQWLECISRNPLKAEVGEGIVYAALPAIISLVLKVIDWRSVAFFTPLGRSVMNFWFWCAWGAFALGIMMAIAVLTTPYRRDESAASRS